MKKNEDAKNAVLKAITDNIQDLSNYDLLVLSNTIQQAVIHWVQLTETKKKINNLKKVENG